MLNKKKSPTPKRKPPQSKKKPTAPKKKSLKEEERKEASKKRGAERPPQEKQTTTKKRISMKKVAGSNGSVKSEYISVVKKNLSTPIATLNFCAIYKPHYFTGSHIARYKVSMVLDPNKKDHKAYLESLEKLAVENDVETIGRMTDEGLIMMSYQGRERPKTYLVEKGKKTPMEVELDHDLPKGFKCKVHFDLKRYFDKFGQKNAFTYSPIKVIFYLDEETQKLIEVNDGNSEDCGD